MFLEQLRNLTDEENLLNDATQYSRTNTAWGSIHDYGNIIVPKPGFIGIQYSHSQAVSPGYSCIRVKIGDTLYAIASRLTSGQVGPIPFYCYVWLEAGTYAVEAFSRATDGTTIISLFQIGFFDFYDAEGKALHAYNIPFDLNLASRKTPIGNTSRGILQLYAFAETPAAQTNFENPGDALTNGVSLSIDGVQVAWTARGQDTTSQQCAWARKDVALTLDETHTITITKDNANTVVHLNAFICPWVLPTDQSKIVTINFPQGSTLYGVLEPLLAEETSYYYIGKVRGINLGDADNYYATASDTGIFAFSYNFTFVDPLDSELWLKGWGTCLSHIASDIRGST